jgi:hypothetical protein
MDFEILCVFYVKVLFEKNLMLMLKDQNLNVPEDLVELILKFVHPTFVISGSGERKFITFIYQDLNPITLKNKIITSVVFKRNLFPDENLNDIIIANNLREGECENSLCKFEHKGRKKKHVPIKILKTFFRKHEV